MYSPDASRRQHGAMLLEMIVGLLIGLMVTLAAFGTLAFVQASSLVQGEAFRLQQRADIAMQALEQQLRQAGAVELVSAQSGIAVRFSNAFEGPAVRGEDGANNAPDVLITGYEDNGSARDCLGNQPDAAQAGIRMESRFSVIAGSLRCLGTQRATGNQIIVDQVEDFRVHYGLRTETALGPQFQFVDASAVAGRWSQVGAVRVCLQIASERNLQAPLAEERLDCRGRTLRQNGQMRRIVRTTFSLRNAQL